MSENYLKISRKKAVLLTPLESFSKNKHKKLGAKYYDIIQQTIGQKRPLSDILANVL